MRRHSFPWDETADALTDFASEGGVRLSADGRAFVSADGRWRFDPPPAQSIPEGIRSTDSYLVDLGDRLASMCVVLLRAGSFALGYWEDDELLVHKAKKRYVTRGRGRAQPTHLKTRGKSRYGSRLRLQNAQAQLEDLATRLQDIEDGYTTPEQCWLSCPVRLLSDFYNAKPAPPWPREVWRKVPVHVHEPDFGELERIREILVTGRIEPVEASESR